MSKTFGQKVRAFLKGGDARKLNKFGDDIEKIINNNIKAAQQEVEDLEEKIEEQEEAFNDSIFNVNTDKMSSVDRRKDYADIYIENLLTFEDRHIEPLRSKIEALKEEIKRNRAVLKQFKTAEPHIEEEEVNE